MAQGCVYKTGRFMHQRDPVDLPLLCWQKGGDCLHRLHEHEHTRLRLAAPSAEQLLASPRGTPVTTRYKTSQHICKQVHQQNHPVVKEYWFWPGYEFLYISWDGMGVLTSRLGGRPTVDQQPASRMKKRGTWVAKCSPNRAGSGGCGCEWGRGLKGLFID